MKRKYFFVILFLVLAIFLVGCTGNGGPISPINQNQPPIITSTPITTTTIGLLYTYDVDATDPDGDIITYSLVTKPNGMNISDLAGVTTWTPDTSGNYNVTVNASKTRGRFVCQI